MSNSFLNHLEWRHATKAFDAAKKISETDLTSILRAIRMAPSSYGLQPFHVEVVKDQSLKEKLLPHAWGQKQIVTCSALLVFVAHSDVDAQITKYIELSSGGNADVKAQLAGYENMMRSSFKDRSEGDLKTWAQKQAYIALGFGLAASAELQINSCPMEGFIGPEFDKILGLEKGQYSSVLLAVGYPDPTVSQPPKVRFSDKELFHHR